LAAQNIKTKDPSFVVVHPKIRDHRSWPHFKNCIGAIDGTHILVTVPLSEQAVHINRHGYCSQNVMAICNWWQGGLGQLMTHAYGGIVSASSCGYKYMIFLNLFYEKWILLTLSLLFVGKIQVTQIERVI
jgi:hypothetical protein